MAGNSLRLQVILDTLDRSSGPLKRILQGSKGLSKQLRDTTSKLRQMEAAQASLGKHRELETQAANTSAELTKQRRQLQAMQSAYAAAEAPTLKMTRALAKQADVVGKLDRKQQSQRTELSRSGAALSAAGYQVGRLGTHQRELTSEIAKANAELAEQRRRLDRIGQVQRRNARIHSAGMKASLHGAGMVAGGMVAARASLKPAQAYAEQETAAVQLRAASMGASGQVSAGYGQMLAKAQELGNKLPGTTAELIEMFTMLRRQGMSEKTILGGLGESAAYLGAQLRMPYTEAAEFAAKLQDATGATEGEMLKLSDTIQRTFYLGVESDNMLAGFSKLSPALSILRKRGAEAADELAPLLVMADQANLLGESAGNAFRKVFQYSMDAGKVGKANALMKGSGIKLDFTDGKGEFAGLDAMYKQLEKLRGLNTQDRLAVLKKLYGDDAETLQAVSMMIDKGKAGYLEVQAKMRAQASLQARVNANLGTLSNLWEAATGTFTNVLATFGAAAAPELKALVTWSGNLAAKFQVWAANNPRLAKTLSLLAIGGTALMVVLGGLLVGGGMAAMAIMQMHTAFTVLTAGRGLAMAGPMLGRMASMIGGVGRAVLMLGRFLLMTPIGLALGAIGLAGYMVWKNWDGIKGGAILLWQDVSAAAVRAWDWMKAKVATLGSAFSGAWALVTTLVTSWPGRMLDLGRNMVQGLVSGIAGMGGAVKDALGGIANGAVTRLKNLLGIRSPSRVFAALGGHTIAGFTQGMLGGQGGAQAALRRIGAGLRTAGAGMALGAATAATASPALQARIDTRAPLGPAAGAPIQRVIEHRTYEIKIDAAGGDAQAIKQAVRQAIEDLENERRVRSRSALSDYD